MWILMDYVDLRGFLVDLKWIFLCALTGRPWGAEVEECAVGPPRGGLWRWIWAS